MSDWNATQHLKFNNECILSAMDLLTKAGKSAAKSILDWAVDLETAPNCWKTVF